MARGAFWTIIVDEQPTAFRAPVREDLLPTLKQLQRQHPTATIKWFQRGRLWETPGDAMDANKPPRRGPGWRPGGDHKDPREQYKVPRDVKRARWASQAAEGRGPWVKGQNAERHAPDGERRGRTPSSGTDTRPPRAADRPREGDRPAWKPNPDGSPRKPGGKRPFAPRGESGDGERRERGASGERPAFRPKPGGGRATDRPRETRGQGDRPAWRPKGDGEARPTGERSGWRPKPSTERGERPAWRPKAEGDRRGPAGKPAWRPKPGGDRGGDRPFTPRPPGAGGKTGWKPSGDRPARPASAEGRTRPSGPRPDWRERRGPDRDGPPRGAAGDRPRTSGAPKKGKTWRVGELPPADRKKKKPED